MIVLALETSCDESSAAILRYANKKFTVLANCVASQIELHKITGGVVPEVAAREHVKNILPVVEAAFAEAKIKPEKIDRIAVTTGPGLITSLMVGVQVAQVLAGVWKKPLFSVNHLSGHLAANFLLNKKITYPALGLIVSGGHTELVLMKKIGAYKVIGSTRDDAAGECFDKTAKILGLAYPGGPEISRLAVAAKNPVWFPRPMLDSPDLDFSFSGLKTAVLYYKQNNKAIFLPNVCAGIEQAIADVLIAKTKRAAEKYQVKTLLLAGGVAANPELRRQFLQAAKSLIPKTSCLIPDLKYCTDQAAMIGAAGALLKKPTPLHKVLVDPNWEL